MVSERLGLSKSEIKKSWKIFAAALILILSVTIALLIEYMVDDTLQELSLVLKIGLIATFLFLIVCLSAQLSK